MSEPVSHKDYSDDEIRELNERFIASGEIMQLRIVTQLGFNLAKSRDEIAALQAEIADLRSREVIEHDSIYYAPLGITNGTWEWFDASEGICAYVGGESIPRELYVALPGVYLEKFAMAYPTREAALQALRDAIETVKKGEGQP